MAKYYTLAFFIDGKWSPEFGDYDKETVIDELTEVVRLADDSNVCRIVVSEDDQAAIDHAFALLNV